MAAGGLICARYSPGVGARDGRRNKKNGFVTGMRGLTIVVGLVLVGIGGWFFFGTSEAPRPGAAAQQAPAAGGERAVQVVTAKVRRAEVEGSYVALGTANSNDAVIITTKVTGTIRSINFTEGQLVNKGDVLVELDDRELKASLASAEADASMARQNYDRAAQLLTSGSSTKARVEDLKVALQGAEAKAEVARARLADYVIRAPFPGRLGLRRVSVGTLVSTGQGGTVISTLDDISTIKLDFSVPETMLSRIQPKARVTAKADALPGRTFEGVVKTVDSRIDPVTRAVEIRAEVPNPDLALQSGMLMAVYLTLDVREGALLIPEEALVPQGTQQYVFLIDNGKAVKRPVAIGERQRGFVEVRDGLAENDTIIVGGLQRVREGTAVRAIQGSTLVGS